MNTSNHALETALKQASKRSDIIIIIINNNNNNNNNNNLFPLAKPHE